MAAPTPSFNIRGVCEGFYGRPWSAIERQDCFSMIKKLGMNTYMHAPKDDPFHRRLWRKKYPAARVAALGELIARAVSRRVQFIYAIHPGLDIDYASQADFHKLVAKCRQVVDLGAQGIALLMDDIEPKLGKRAARQFKTIGQAHAQLANRLMEEFPKTSIFLCPTEYCTEFAKGGLRSPYLKDLGTHLQEDIHVFWTGPRIISQNITQSHARRVSDVFQRKITLWDNLFANDYAPLRAFLCPYQGRSSQLSDYIDGVLINPHTPFRLNYIALWTTADYLRDPENYQPLASWTEAARSWVGPEFLPLIRLISYFHWSPFALRKNGNEYVRKAGKILFSMNSSPALRADFRRQTQRWINTIQNGLVKAPQDPYLMIDLWPVIQELEHTFQEFLLRLGELEAESIEERRRYHEKLAESCEIRFNPLQRLRSRLFSLDPSQGASGDENGAEPMEED
jgi:hypothetical protein